MDPPTIDAGETLMPKTVILSAARTPIGKLGGGLASVDATELGATAIAPRSTPAPSST